MFGLFDDLTDVVGDVVGKVMGIPIATLAITLGVSERMVRKALDSGCKTVDEIKDFLR